MKVPPFATKLCVFSLLFYTALRVSAYKQAIFRCYLTNYKKGQVTELFLRGYTDLFVICQKAHEDGLLIDRNM
jgi:hypothetical protein